MPTVHHDGPGVLSGPSLREKSAAPEGCAWPQKLSDWTIAPGAIRGNWWHSVHFSLDTVVLVGLVAIIGAFAIVVGATAAIEAVSQARGSLPAANEELPLVQPMRLSIIVNAQGRMSEPLQLRFTLADPAVTMIQIELANQLDREARTAECAKTAPKVFVAEVEPSSAGITPIHIGMERRSDSHSVSFLPVTGRQGAEQFGSL